MKIKKCDSVVFKSVRRPEAGVYYAEYPIPFNVNDNDDKIRVWTPTLGVSSELFGISVDEIDDIRIAVRWFDTVESDYIPKVSCADKIIEMPTIAMNPKSSRRLTLAYFMSFDYSRVKLWIVKRSYIGCSRGICCTQENSKNFLYVLDYEARLKEYNELNRWVNNQKIVQQGI